MQERESVFEVGFCKSLEDHKPEAVEGEAMLVFTLEGRSGALRVHICCNLNETKLVRWENRTTGEAHQSNQRAGKGAGS